MLLECEGDAVDLSGDMGAVGRFTVDRRDDELLLDLKGVFSGIGLSVCFSGLQQLRVIFEDLAQGAKGPMDWILFKRLNELVVIMFGVFYVRPLHLFKAPRFLLTRYYLQDNNSALQYIFGGKFRPLSELITIIICLLSFV